MTEEDTFNRLKRHPISADFINALEPEEIGIDQFKSLIAGGTYDSQLAAAGWERLDFLIEYSEWIKQLLDEIEDQEST